MQHQASLELIKRCLVEASSHSGSSWVSSVEHRVPLSPFSILFLPWSLNKFLKMWVKTNNHMLFNWFIVTRDQYLRSRFVLQLCYVWSTLKTNAHNRPNVHVYGSVCEYLPSSVWVSVRIVLLGSGIVWHKHTHTTAFQNESWILTVHIEHKHTL